MISREEAKGIIYNEILEATAMLSTQENTEEETEFLKRFIEACNMAISVLSQPERPKGRWVKDGDWLICMECDSEINVKNSIGIENRRNFCPNCGSDNRGEEE